MRPRSKRICVGCRNVRNRRSIMSYTRIYADADGESHFEDLSPEMMKERYAGAEWLISAPMAVSDLRFRRVTTEFPDEPHVAPRRQLVVALVGEAEVEVS